MYDRFRQDALRHGVSELSTLYSAQRIVRACAQVRFVRSSVFAPILPSIRIWQERPLEFDLLQIRT